MASFFVVTVKHITNKHFGLDRSTITLFFKNVNKDEPAGGTEIEELQNGYYPNLSHKN